MNVAQIVTRGTALIPGFTPVEHGEKAAAAGPGSNTGQKASGALIDFVTLVIPRDALEPDALTNLSDLTSLLFGTQHEISVGALRQRMWQFYPQSAVMVDREGEVVGRIGVGEESVCVSLSGAGCRWVRNWPRVARLAESLGARMSRVDVAFDDLDGECLNVHKLRERAFLGDFGEGGRPPRHRFISDEGHGTGSTLYVGGKGHKELCVYEKGKQLGLPSSKWTRAEVRLYGKHVELSFEILSDPLSYLLGAYSVLQEVIRGVCSRLRTIKRAVDVSGRAWVNWLSRQVGPSVHLLRQAFGSEWAAFAEQHVARAGHPGRFRGISKGDQLAAMLREELSCLSSV